MNPETTAGMAQCSLLCNKGVGLPEMISVLIRKCLLRHYAAFVFRIPNDGETVTALKKPFDWLAMLKIELKKKKQTNTCYF